MHKPIVAELPEIRTIDLVLTHARATMAKQQFVFMNTTPGGNVFRFRGLARPEDDPASFAEKMYESRGHCVVVRDEFANAEDVTIPDGFPAPTARQLAQAAVRPAPTMKRGAK